MTHKERALAKLEIELQKDILIAIEMAKHGGIFELLYFIYQLHFVRLSSSEVANNEQTNGMKSYSHSLEESIKYSIALIIKHGYLGYAHQKEDNMMVFNYAMIESLQTQSNYINSKYETAGLIKLFDVQVSGERDQDLRIDTSVAETDEDVKKLFAYFLRVSHDNEARKALITTKDQLIAKFKSEYQPFEDLFLKEMGITVDEFCSIYEKLLSKIADCQKSKENLLAKFPNGNVDVEDQRTFIHFSSCYLNKKADIYSLFDDRFHAILNKLTFDKDSFNEKELKFHQLTRQPLLPFKDALFLSPELILDSLFTNTHYSLVEATESRDVYIARQATAFLDKISSIAKEFGFYEFAREIDLFEGKNQIGDIDLILMNDREEFLLVEAKNHALPMDVYFSDVAKTQDHLKYQQIKWEKKVQRRVDFLKENHATYSISDKYNYIVVSKYPEVISHYSTLFIISIQELRIWFQNFYGIYDFSEFHDKISPRTKPKWTKEEMEEMRKAKLLLGTFAKE